MAEGDLGGRKRGTADAFVGRAAELAVAAELLRRQCTVAIPEVDLGTDLFAFRDGRPGVARLQVKASATPKPYRRGGGFSARFSLPMRQLRQARDAPPLFYALAVFQGGVWSEAVVVSRAELFGLFTGGDPFGSVNAKTGELELLVSFRARVECSGRDLTHCRNAWESLPPFRDGDPLGPPPAAA